MFIDLHMGLFAPQKGEPFWGLVSVPLFGCCPLRRASDPFTGHCAGYTPATTKASICGEAARKRNKRKRADPGGFLVPDSNCPSEAMSWVLTQAHCEAGSISQTWCVILPPQRRRRCAAELLGRGTKGRGRALAGSWSLILSSLSDETSLVLTQAAAKPGGLFCCGVLYFHHNEGVDVRRSCSDEVSEGKEQTLAGP